MTRIGNKPAGDLQTRTDVSRYEDKAPESHPNPIAPDSDLKSTAQAISVAADAKGILDSDAEIVKQNLLASIEPDPMKQPAPRDLSQTALEAHGCPGCPHPGVGPGIQSPPDKLVNLQKASGVIDNKG
jgi:hypothetical protein